MTSEFYDYRTTLIPPSVKWVPYADMILCLILRQWIKNISHQIVMLAQILRGQKGNSRKTIYRLL